MREDMFKVIVERPRLGVHKAPRTKLRQERTGRAFIGMKRQANQQNAWTKLLNENLRPLERYLWKQRGRKWNDVYSDICACLDTGSTVKMHVREHIDDFVERRVRIDENGNWWAVGWRMASPQGPAMWADLYVDPQDGILKETGALRANLGIAKYRYRRPDAEKRDDWVMLGDGQALHRERGIWYQLTLGQSAYRKPDCASRTWLDVPRTDIDPRFGAWHYGIKEWREVVVKRQLGKKELKQYGLKGGAHV